MKKDQDKEQKYIYKNIQKEETNTLTKTLPLQTKLQERVKKQ